MPAEHRWFPARQRRSDVIGRRKNGHEQAVNRMLKRRYARTAREARKEAGLEE